MDKPGLSENEICTIEAILGKDSGLSYLCSTLAAICELRMDGAKAANNQERADCWRECMATFDGLAMGAARNL